MTEQVLHENRFFKVCNTAGYFVIRERTVKNGVVAVVIDPQDRFLIAGLQRQAVGQLMYEFPRGAIDPNESALQAGAREVQEETGLSCADLTSLGIVHSNTSLIASHVEVVLAKLTSAPGVARDGEVAEVLWLTADELKQWIAQGKITDGHTLSAWALYQCR